MLQILFALLAGVLTVGAPCILPMLPIILGTSIGYSSKTRPLFITFGFILAFALVAFLFGTFTRVFGISEGALRDISVVLLMIFGLFMIAPTPFEKLTQYIHGLINRASNISQASGNGNFGGFVLGVMLGVIWTPCAGPVLGVILTLIATKQNLGQAAGLLLAYAIGAGVPMLLIAYGGQYVTTKVRAIARYSRTIEQVFGILIILLAVAIYFQYDTVIEAKLLQYAPGLNLTLPGVNNNSQANLKTDLGHYGPAPEFTGIDNWLNGGPQTIAGLKGKVVLVDFWTYSCINCIRSLPYVINWYQTYKDQGLVVIGVHTPEFPFEKDPGNVARAISQFGIPYPVAQDNEYGTWNAYQNDSWPAEYLIDQSGQIVSEHFGEGDYDIMENNIRKLLAVPASVTMTNTASTIPDFNQLGSPEMYFGLARQEYLSPAQNASPQPANYSLPPILDLNQFAVGGLWQFSNESAQLVSGPGKILLHFHSSKVYMVAQSAQPITVTILIDGKVTNMVTIQASQLYTLYTSSAYADHELEIDIPAGGLTAFTFTFG